MFGKSRKKAEIYQQELIEKHFAEVENIYQKMRGWRHDYNNHMQVLKAYLSEKKYDEAEAYVDALSHDLASVDMTLKTGNIMVDAILNSKISLMQSRKIKVDATAFVPAKLSVSEIDLCILIGNLLDNAMEACMALPEEERFVIVYIKSRGTNLYLSFTNSAGKKLAKKENIFISTKGENHGFGLVRVDDIVKKYGGILTRASEDGGFTTELLLPIE